MNTRAESLARALGGYRAGTGWMARCPAHEDGTPSLSIAQSGARVLVHCHAGCAQRRVLDALQARRLWCAEVAQRVPFARPRPPPPSVEALALWRAARPAQGSAVETWLAARGLRLPPGDALRLHPALRHRAGGWWPAMVALVRHGESGEAQAIHRTWLARDGAAKAPLAPPRMMLGPCRGGAVRLSAAAATLMVGEGIETCLAAMQATGIAAWAALSSGGLMALSLPPVVRTVIVLADGDDPGERAAQAAARRWQDEGRTARIARPPRGMDFNDLLLRGSSLPPEGEGGARSATEGGCLNDAAARDRHPPSALRAPSPSGGREQEDTAS